MKLLQTLLLSHELSTFPCDSLALIFILHKALLCVHARKSLVTQQGVNERYLHCISLLEVLVLA